MRSPTIFVHHQKLFGWSNRGRWDGQGVRSFDGEASRKRTACETKASMAGSYYKNRNVRIT